MGMTSAVDPITTYRNMGLYDGLLCLPVRQTTSLSQWYIITNDDNTRGHGIMTPTIYIIIETHISRRSSMYHLFLNNDSTLMNIIT